tara:strand:+ start:3896 stop:4135 length:240 start_codon:yes stop_codon:yes gene_type:complete
MHTIKIMKSEIYRALELKYLAQQQEAVATLEVYFNRPAGIGEHPQIIEEMDKQVALATEAEDKLDYLKNHFAEYKNDLD